MTEIKIIRTYDPTVPIIDRKCRGCPTDGGPRCASCPNTKPERKIVTKYDPPPIPWRGADWTATFGEYDLGDPIGTGATEKEAIADLMIEAEE